MKKFEDKTAVIKIRDGKITIIRKKNKLLMLMPYGINAYAIFSRMVAIKR